jgi:hypothetical protein
MAVVMLAVRRAMPRKSLDRFDEHAHRLALIDRESHAPLW